jgi:cyclophilin family peptidyl-prolyl cis-trans isomerase
LFLKLKLDFHPDFLYNRRFINGETVMRIKWFIGVILSVIAGISSAANPQVTLHISGAVTGDIVLEIYADKAPVTAANFINYVQGGFYNGLIFHRVVSGFMIQGGGFDTNLVAKTTGPAIISESSNGLSNLRGTIAMARTADPHSATSQFFINHVDNAFLDDVPVFYSGGNAYKKYGYCVFGRVISGISVVDAIAALPTTTESGVQNVPVNDVIIQSASVTFNAPVCATKLEGDVDGDCNVDMADFFKLAQNWLACNSITSACNS